MRILRSSIIACMLTYAVGCLFTPGFCSVADDASESAKALIKQFRPAPPPPNGKVTYQDLNGDGKPELLRTTMNGFPIQWIDDDGDMKEGDVAGESADDCLMVDRNRDGDYGGPSDLMVKYADENGDGRADVMMIAENGRLSDTEWGPGHFMIVIDTDQDGVLNNIDWKTMTVQCWERVGQCGFYSDYVGKSLFIKAHASTFCIRDLRYNWENPFLFYDPDNDGLTEMAIRFLDNWKTYPEPESGYPADGNMPDSMRRMEFTKKICGAYLTFDLDNDNEPGNEFDYDMTLRFTGPGFDYQDQIHHFKRLQGPPEADRYFYDPRWRHLTELAYPDHDAAWNLIFKRGKWSSVWFAFDEDHDCKRWERVELYDPLDPFKAGPEKGGLDNNVQADRSGDRGEWDIDGSGGGKLYISRFDGRIHLYGAEWGAWRIDQDATYFQGWNNVKDIPKAFATIKYTDTNNNGFFDKIEYDMDGDAVFERAVSLNALGIDDRCDIIDTSKMTYGQFGSLYAKVSIGIWDRAKSAVRVGIEHGVDLGYYGSLMHPRSEREKDKFGYWLQYYIYQDLRYQAAHNGEKDGLAALDKAYFSGEWK